MRALRKSLLLLALAAAPLPAAAQTCGGFTDVSPADFFCNDVEWIGNRQVTFGCTATEYCPSNFVLRAQMAAFLRRLGDALTATILRIQDAAFNGTYSPQAVGCIGPNPGLAEPPGESGFLVANYPRQATFMATLMNYNASATKTIQGRLVFSTTGAGGPWTPTGDFVMWQTVEPAERSTLTLVGGPLNLDPGADPGTTYHFGIEASTNDPAATVSGECQLNVRIESRTGAASPF